MYVLPGLKVKNSTIQTNHQPEAKIFQFIILTFVYSSTCFGRFPTQHQELNDCSPQHRCDSLQHPAAASGHPANEDCSIRPGLQPLETAD